MHRSQLGFSFIEVLVVTSLIGVLAAIAIPNFANYKVRAHDAMAQADYTNIKTAAFAELSDPELTPSYAIFNQEGPGSLPVPLDTVALSPNVQLSYSIRLQIGNFFDLFALQLGHEQGTHWYRFIALNGTRIEQVIQK